MILFCKDSWNQIDCYEFMSVSISKHNYIILELFGQQKRDIFIAYLFMSITYFIFNGLFEIVKQRTYLLLLNNALENCIFYIFV